MAKLKELLCGLEYELISGDLSAEISDIVYDSRKTGPEMLFVCMKGSRADSHAYIPEAFERGCRAFAVSEKEAVPEELMGAAAFIYCEDTRAALSLMSQAFFGYPARRLSLIGITGTKGKTTTAYMVKSILEHAGFKTGIIGTVGCEIGDEKYPTTNTTPESYEIQKLLYTMAEKGCTHAVMECSSQGFKMRRLAGLRFDIGAFLNISPDHIGPDEHEDFEEYLSCKAMLFPASDKLIYNACAEHIDDLFRACGMEKSEERAISFGICRDKEALDISGDEPCYRASELSYIYEDNFSGMGFLLSGPGFRKYMRLSLPGEHNVSNALCAAAICHELSVSEDVIGEALTLIRVNGRLETVYSGGGIKVLIDYAHNEESMQSLIRTLRNYDPGRIVVVFGCGGNRSVERRTGMGHVAAEHADFTVMTSDNPRREEPEAIIDDIENAYLKAGGRKDAYVRICDRREAIAFAMKNAKEGDLIAVIGKGHEEYQEINGVRHHFSDREEIEKIAGELTK